ncbi:MULTISPECIES: hypothetical protein [Bradyrhizobium]|uniref:hypothetical protein n=1 Tax=Bradyrhizobium TaxID=374 RepID=UPI001EDBC9C3|nr:hypothetical protein [Bradyrhizobium zhengyangense]MCG2645723.1 hypothetical protein [Bradyrhizobium zhengyangense]
MISPTADLGIGPYYGLDYLASGTAIGGMYFVGDSSRNGPALYALSSLSMIGFALLAASPPILITNVIALALAIRAFRRWSTHKA